MSAARKLGRKLDWFPFYYRAWMDDEAIRLMSPTEESYYLRLLCVQFAEGSLPDDPRQLATLIARDLRKFRSIWVKLRNHFDVVSDPSKPGVRIANGYMSEVRAGQREQYEKAVESGSRGGKQRAKNATSARGNTQGTLEGTLEGSLEAPLKGASSKEKETKDTANAVSSCSNKLEQRADTQRGTLGLVDGNGEGGKALPAHLAEPSPSRASLAATTLAPALALEFEDSNGTPKKRGKREPSPLDLAAYAILAAVWLVVIAEHPGLGMTRKAWFTRNANAARDLASLEPPKTPEQVANGFVMLYTDPLCVERNWNRTVMLTKYQEHLHDLKAINAGKVRSIRSVR